jgi:hypothetical protein
MYEDGAKQLGVILELVKKCPDALQEKCFTILLQGYVDSEQARIVAPQAPVTSLQTVEAPPAASAVAGEAPPEVRGRLAALAKRLHVEEEELEELFDFTADPFVYNPLAAPGDTNADKTRNVALLVAVRTYLATGTWTADWSEVKALCIDLNCYDAANHAAHLRKGEGRLFKTVAAGKTIELSGPGRTAAEQVLAGLLAGQ